MKAPHSLYPLIALLGILPLQASVIATPSFDYNAQISGALAEGQYLTVTNFAATNSNPNAYNFGVLEFDLNGLSLAGEKHLVMQAQYFHPTVGSNTGRSTTASRVVRVVAIGASVQDLDGGNDGDFKDMTVSNEQRLEWYNTNVVGTDRTVGSLNFMGRNAVSVDVTETVNQWILYAQTNGAQGQQNFGFGLILDDIPSESINQIRINTTEAADSTAYTVVRPHLADSPVPEPSAAACALLALGALTRRRR